MQNAGSWENMFIDIVFRGLQRSVQDIGYETVGNPPADPSDTHIGYGGHFEVRVVVATIQEML